MAAPHLMSQFIPSRGGYGPAFVRRRISQLQTSEPVLTAKGIARSERGRNGHPGNRMSHRRDADADDGSSSFDACKT